ncbi:penicillin acylase family protein [Microvirga massiliensis]|uniref:penicillin acylase family protein n=1 Tax=Microvirga massiliensis TaxID=1033741 RepID=UPI001FCCD566|nr:penicillin acylase family protein [Microvirga massiliensis]
MTVGRLTMGGSAFSPFAATYRAMDFRVTAGASFRIVLDVGNWDQSVTINTPGQSGDPFSPHYRDLAPPVGQRRICAADLFPPGRRASGSRGDQADASSVVLTSRSLHLDMQRPRGHGQSWDRMRAVRSR